MNEKLNKKEEEYAKLHKIDKRVLIKIKNFYQTISVNKDEWINKFEENPYKLVKMEGYGFIRVDNLAKKIGYDMCSPKRILAYTNYAIEKISQGSTIVSSNLVIEEMKKDLKINDINLIAKVVLENEGDYLLLNQNCKRLTIDDIMSGLDIPQYITTKNWYNTEKFVYEWLRKVQNLEKINYDTTIKDNIIKKCKFPLSEEQSCVVNNILEKNINLLIGRAGTGKSYVTRIVLDLLDRHNETYCLLAPTGIASVNILDKTGREAKTIHRRYYERDDNGNVIPIEEKYLIIDEIGMCGVDHFKMIKEMVPDKDVKIIFIGDKYQLGSISAGDFLSSIMKLIKNKVVDGNIFELKKIMRASSESYIPYLSNMFCGDSKFDSAIVNKKDLKGVSFCKRENDLPKQLNDIIKNKGWNFDDTCIIIPQKVGDYGCNPVNDYFHSNLNKPLLYCDEKGYKRYKKDDVLMNLRNNRMKGIYNGEKVNLIKKIDDTYILKRVYDGELFEYTNEEMVDVGLSYSNTIHKLQGSTIKNVIFVCIKPHSFMLNRNIVYTSISRASEEVIVLYDDNMLEYSSRKTITDIRKTFLGLIADMSTKK